MHLETKGKGTTWTSGQFSVGDLYGSARRPSASVTRPLMHYCQWQGSSMDGRSTVRGKFTPCRAPASTACGRPWRASLWSPVRARRAAETTVTHTQSSDLDFSSLLLSLHISFSAYHFIPTSVPNYSCTSSLSCFSSRISLIFCGDCAKVCHESGYNDFILSIRTNLSHIHCVLGNTTWILKDPAATLRELTIFE